LRRTGVQFGDTTSPRLRPWRAFSTTGELGLRGPALAPRCGRRRCLCGGRGTGPYTEVWSAHGDAARQEVCSFGRNLASAAAAESGFTYGW